MLTLNKKRILLDAIINISFEVSENMLEVYKSIMMK